MSIGRIVNSPSRSFFVVLVSFCVGVVLGSTELFWISQLPFIVAVLLAITAHRSFARCVPISAVRHS